MKFRFILLVSILIPLMAACAATTAPGPCPDNLEPMYGGQAKSPACKTADDRFIAGVMATGVTRAQGAEEMARLGFDYLGKGDVNTAIRRFNQAWLLDPENCTAFNGFGIIKHMRDHDDAEAMRMFETGLELCPDNGWIKSDYGRVLEESGRFKEAVAMFERSLEQLPDNPEAYKGLIRSHIRLGNDEACLNAMERGMAHGLSFDPRLVEELRARVRQAQ